MVGHKVEKFTVTLFLAIIPLLAFLIMPGVFREALIRAGLLPTWDLFTL